MPGDMTVANTILAQLGGHRFTVFTGSSGYIGDETSLKFRIGSNPKRWTYCRICLNGSDLYDVTFSRWAGGQLVAEETTEDVCFMDLQDVFTYNTGLDTHL